MAAEDLELVDWPDKAPLSASARRAALRFPLRMKTRAGSDPALAPAVRVKGIKLAGDRRKAASSYQASAAPLVLRDDGEMMAGEVSLQLDRSMPPGQYVASLEIAGLERDVSFNVVEDTSLRIRPSPVVVDATGGRAKEVSVSFENRGNIPLSIDVRGDYPLGREEPLAADVTDTESVLAVLTAALNRAPGVLTEVGTVAISMPDGPFTLAPGSTHTGRIAVASAVEFDPTRRYRAFIPVFASEIEIAIVTASKPEAGTSAARGGGKKKRS